MTNAQAQAGSTILLAEEDVLIRIAIAEFLRGCGFRVIEAASELEAKTVLQMGPEIHVLMADARLAGGDGGFALAQWTRRHRPAIKVMLSVTLDNKTEAAARLCGGAGEPSPAVNLRTRISAMTQRRRTAGARGPAARRAGR